MLSKKGFLAALTLLSAGCGAASFPAALSAAETRLEEARAMGAETAAPFEYYTAAEALRRARIEAAGERFGAAARTAETAEIYAQRAVSASLASR